MTQVFLIHTDQVGIRSEQETLNQGKYMNKFQNPVQKEKVAVFLVRLSLELRKNTKLQWSGRFNRFI